MKETAISKQKFAKDLFFEAFEDSDDFLSRFEKIAFSPERCHYIKDGETVISALYWFDCESSSGNLAYIYGVATRKSHRGRGLCKRLFEETHKILKERDYKGALLVPAEDSLYPFYERLGYRVATFISEKTVTSSEGATHLYPLDKYDYSVHRRNYLPEGSVAEGKEALDFLASYAEFYRGDDFLAVVERRDGKLRITELLGNSGKAPEIVSTLGFDTAVLRTPGNDRPFAMFYPLTEDAPDLSYFGLALD